MKILVVEDEPIIADDLEFMLEEMGYQQIETVHSGEEALNSIEKQVYDLVLLDINLEGKVDGVHVAEILHEKKSTPFIFLTSLSDAQTLERVKKTYPAGYLVKPIDEKDLRVNIEISLSNFNTIKESNEIIDYPDSFYVKDKSRMSKVIADEIQYLEGSNNYTIIHTLDKKFVLSQTLKAVQRSLDPDKFVRIHKSAVVNIDKIEVIEDAHVRIKTYKLPIGRTYRADFFNRLDTI